MSKFTQDQILYVVMSKGGGIDGMSRDKPRAKFASFEKKDTEKQLDAWHELKLVAMTGDELVKMRKAAIEKLDGIERLLVETFHQETMLQRLPETERRPNPRRTPYSSFNSLASQIAAVENGEIEPH